MAGPCHNDIRALQERFAAALRAPELPVPYDILVPDGSQPTRRFNVYRNTVHASLSAAIAARFPVVKRLVGDEFFQAMALCFVSRFPPSSPILAQYGNAFPAFLATFEPAQELPYLAGVARLEWARSEAYHAADAQVIRIEVLQQIAPEMLHETRLSVHPAARAVASAFPVVSIWRTNTHDDETAPIAVDCGGEAALVTRPHLDVLVTPIAQTAAAMFGAFKAGASLGEAFAAADGSDDGMSAGECLAQLFVAGAFAGTSTQTQR